MLILNVPTVLALVALAGANAQTPAAPAAPPAKKAVTAPKPAGVKPAAAKPAAVKPAAAKPAAKPAAAKANPNDPVVMTVGDQTMTKSEFEAFLTALPEQARMQATGPTKRKFAEQVAEMKALAYEARRRHLDQAPETKQKIALQIDNLLASELYRTVTATVKTDEAALRAYYDQHKSESEAVKASHILIRFKSSPAPARAGQKELTEEEALAKAKEIREKLVKGADFAELARTESDDTGSGANGGSLGTFGHGQMVGPFEEAAFSLPVNEISQPVKTQFGYHLIKVQEHANKTFEELKDQIENRLKQEAARKAVDDVKKTVPVTIDDTYFGKP